MRIGAAGLSVAQARRIALAAQGFTDPRPASPTRRHLQRVLGRIQLIQMDSVSVAVRAHYMPLYSRLGAYDRSLLDKAAWMPTSTSPRMLVEYWAHEAALIPVADWSLFGWRREDYADGRWWKASVIEETHPGLRAAIHSAIAELGPSTSGVLEKHLGHVPAAERGTWWDRSAVKRMCEAMFASGELAATRDTGFARHYCEPADVIDAPTLTEKISRPEAMVELMRRSVRALGIGIEADLRDYYRLPVADARAALAELVASGEVEQVTVAGWKQPAYLDPSARMPRRVEGDTLLSPFDSLIFFRPRVQRLFDFDYRIEIYVPEHKRVHGYYVFPFLMDGELVARVDLKADRAAGVLRVQSAHAEANVGADADEVPVRLAASLHDFAGWLDLDDVLVADRGDLAPALRRALA